MDGYAIVINAYNTGNYFETYMQYAVQPQPLSNQSLTLLNTTLVGGTRTMVFERSLAGVDGEHYTFTAQAQTMNIEWAYGNRPFDQHIDRGATTMQIVSVPEPGSTAFLMGGAAVAALRRRRKSLCI